MRCPAVYRILYSSSSSSSSGRTSSNSSWVGGV